MSSVMHTEPTSQTPDPLPDSEPLPQCLTLTACLLLARGADGWTGLYCAQGREDAPATRAYLSRYYPDGLARLQGLGDLVALGGTPGQCPRMDEDGDYLPARDPEYPPAPQADLAAVCEAWHLLHPVLDFVCAFTPEEGWRTWDAWGQRRLHDA